MTKLTRNTQLLYEIGCLRYVQRQWRQFLNPDFENLSEHIVRVSFIALLIAEREQKRLEKTKKKTIRTQINIEKVLKMALVHDLSESRSVDVHYLSRQYVERDEQTAVQDSLRDTDLEASLLPLWEEYEQRESLESKIVKDADNLDVDFELQEQATRGFTLPKDFFSMRKHVAQTKLYTKTAKELWKNIYKSNPHDWHLQGKNRVRSGDWKK